MRSLGGILVALLLAAPAGLADVHRFDGGLWFDGARFAPRTVWVIDGRFAPAPGRDPDRVIDLGGAFVIPPFADAHHHAFAGGRDPEPEIQRFLGEGIFYVKNPNNLPRLLEPVRPKVNLPASVDVVWSNGGFTSSGGHPTQLYAQNASAFGMKPEEMPRQAYFVVDDERDLAREWPAFLATGPGFVKAYLEHSEEHAKRATDPAFVGERGLDPALLSPIVKRAAQAGLRVSAHIATAADFRAVVAAGVDEINHLPLEKLTREDALAAAKKGVRVVTTTISHRPLDGVTDLDAVHRHNLGLLKAAGVKLAVGTDDSRTAVAEAENLHRLGVFTPAELLRLWTMETPPAIFPGRKIGSFEPGSEGSFLALNANPLDDFGAIRRIALRVKQGSIVDIRPPRPLATEKLVPVVMSKGVEAAIAEYDRMRKEESEVFDTGEGALNRLGYLMLQHGQTDGAIAVFRANAERFPYSSNVYDSLGEAYAKKGETELAIRNYEKSIELNPHNEHGKSMLEKLRGTRPPRS